MWEMANTEGNIIQLFKITFSHVLINRHGLKMHPMGSWRAHVSDSRYF